ncbi:MAG: Outer rane stress sensor protease DegS [Phycisphaerales bacterium]|nr:Outer rane stress sensor protease DegS [Phycisphaerales bacterium]
MKTRLTPLLWLTLVLFPTARCTFAQPASALPAARAAQAAETERKHAFELSRQAIALLERHDLEGAQAKLGEALAILPDKAVWHYNLACILAASGKRSDALDSLERATECGFTDFTHLESDPDLKSLRELPRYQKLIARKDEIRHHAAERAMAELEQRFGKGYLYEVDEERKLIFATNTDRATLDALKSWLESQTRSQCEQLFTHKPDEFIRVVLPSPADYRKLVKRPGVLGMYEDETRTLLAQRLGQVMTHEFTHALHSADQRSLGQEHPIWLREGLAAMYEAADFEDEVLTPHDNFRLGFVQSAARRQTLIPLEKLLRTTQQDFIAGPNLAYGESSSLMLYLFEQKQLRKFYEAYTATYALDPSGQTALESVTGMNLPELQRAWVAWMLPRSAPALNAGPGGVYLGVHFTTANDGLKIGLVLPGGPAAKAGLKTGDVIVAMGDREIRDYQSLAPLLAAHKPGDEVKVKIRRGQKYEEVPVVLGQR